MTIDVQSALIGVFVTVAVTIEMLLRRRQRRTDVLFVIFSVNLVLWYLATFLRGAVGAQPWERVELAVAALIPASLLRLFVELLRGTSAGPRRLMAAAYPSSALVSVVALSPLGELGPVQAFTALYLGLMILLSARLMVRSAQATHGTVEFARVKYLAIGAAVTTLTAEVGRLPWLGQGAAATGHLVVMIYVFFLSQAITRDRLLDLHEFIGRMVVLSVMALLFVAISAVLVVGLGNSPSLRLFNTVVAVVILLTLYEPLKERLEAKTIELIARERHGLASQLESLRRKMLRVLDPERMAKLVLDTLYDSRRATHAAIYLLEPLGRAFALQAYRGPEPLARVSESDVPDLWHAVHHHRGPLLTEQLSRASRENKESPTSRGLIEAMRRVSADVLLPFVSGDTVLGFLALRDDRVAEPYSTEEIALLMNIGETAVIVLENSQLAMRLRERDRLAAIGEMAAGLAHEIRNPLGAIKGAAEYLEPSRVGTQDEAELFQVIVDEANRLNSVVSQFLDYARPYRAQLAVTDLNEVVRKTAKLLEAQEKARSTPLELNLDPALPAAEIDAEQLKQVILNLVLNAIEASGGDGRPVTITTRHVPERERLELTVRDRGGGIPREALDHIFIPFFTTKQHGTGLGLAVCQRIVTNHGGEIRVESQAGVGTEFIVRLPLRSKKEASTTGSFQSQSVRRRRDDGGTTADLVSMDLPRPRTSNPPAPGSTPDPSKA